MNRDIIDEVYRSSPRTMKELEGIPVYSMLIVIGGYLAIGLGFFHFLVSLLSLDSLMIFFHLMVNLTMGFGLLVANLRISTDTTRWSILAVVLSLVLIALGGIVGAIAGLVSLSGAVMGFFGIDI